MDTHTILALYASSGQERDAAAGVGALQHAWQCARMARGAGASPSLQLAAWLHDLGHLMPGDDGLPRVRGPNDRHELRAAEALLPLFGPSVAEPVALHVLAKRCLASTKVAYRIGLSPEALRRLELQGGLMPNAEARAFLQRPFAPQAMRLRLWDDAARNEALLPPSRAGALEALRRLMWLQGAGAPNRRLGLPVPQVALSSR